MTRRPVEVKGAKTRTAEAVGALANLGNVKSLGLKVMEVNDQPVDSPRILTFYGPSGYGKTTAMIMCMNSLPNIVAISAKAVWTGKDFLEAIAKALGVKPGRTRTETHEIVCTAISEGRTTLFIDETEYILKDNMIPLVRDVYDQTKMPIVLVGEEQLGQRLQRWERVQNRIYDFLLAKPASMDDGRLLIAARFPDLKLSDEALRFVIEKSAGRVRRIVNNLARLQNAYWEDDEVSLQMAETVHLYSVVPPAIRGGE